MPADASKTTRKNRRSPPYSFAGRPQSDSMVAVRLRTREPFPAERQPGRPTSTATAHRPDYNRPASQGLCPWHSSGPMPESAVRCYVAEDTMTRPVGRTSFLGCLVLVVFWVSAEIALAQVVGGGMQGTVRD